MPSFGGRTQTIPVSRVWSQSITDMVWDDVSELENLATITYLHVHVVSPYPFKFSVVLGHPQAAFARDCAPVFSDKANSACLLAGASSTSHGNVYTADARTPPNKCHFRLQRDKAEDCDLNLVIQFLCPPQCDATAEVLVEGEVSQNWQVVRDGKTLTSSGTCSLGRVLSFASGGSLSSRKKPAVKRSLKKKKLSAKGKLSSIRRLAKKAKSKKGKRVKASGKVGKKLMKKKSKSKKSKKSKKFQPPLLPSLLNPKN